MPLGGAGNLLGSVLASAVGAPAEVGGFFATLGGVIASWAPANITILPGAMVAAGGAVSGIGIFTVAGDPNELGNNIAAALGIEPAPPLDSARQKWRDFAAAFCDQLETLGQANGTGLSAGVPLAGAGTVVFTTPVFVPPLSQSLAVTEPVSAAALEAFGAMLLSFIQTNAQVVSLSLSGPPLSAPPDGPVIGTGTIA
jgi:hypothetical protein